MSNRISVQRTLSADYLVVGAGAMGLAFVDELLVQDPSAHVVLVERRAKVGGHWNDAYPFVSLHQPAAFYGVNSEALGTGGAALATGTEVLAYFERVLEKLKATGRLQFFPLCEFVGDGCFRSLVAEGETFEVEVRKKTVNAGYMDVRVPSTTPPKFEIAKDVRLIPLNDLVRIREPQKRYVVIGAGKTGMDALLFLLAQNVDPDSITWVVSHDAWLLQRAGIRPGNVLDWLLGQLETFSQASTLEEVFLTGEKRTGDFFRVDESRWPKKFRCATVDTLELDQLRRLENVIRKGRVLRIDSGRLQLEQGEVELEPESLYVDCTADGLAKKPSRPVFNGDQITLQSVFMCQQVFSAALIAKVETTFGARDDSKKNSLCAPVPHPEFARDYVAAMAVSNDNFDRWGRELLGWLRRSRLSFAGHESLFNLLRVGLKTRKVAPAAMKSIRRIFSEEFPGEEFPVKRRSER